MNTKEAAIQYRLTQWAQALKEKTANGETIDEFCRRSGVSRNTYFYWQRKLREIVCEQFTEGQTNSTELSVPGFAEVKLTDTPIQQAPLPSGQICVEIGDCKITADSNYPTKVLVALIRETRKPC